MLRQQLIVFCVMCALFITAFYLTQNHLADPWQKLALNPELSERLMDAIDNQKNLARLDPDRAARYRGQFEQTQMLLKNMEILRESHADLSFRYRMIPAVLFAAALLVLVLSQVRHHMILGKRLTAMRIHLERLAAGDTVEVASSHGLLGRIDSMIAEVSRVFGRSQRRVKQLENLQQWQESSRRIAHEIKTPLTSLGLEAKNLAQICARSAPEQAEVITAARHSVEEEIKQLNDFTRRFTSFAKIGRPKLAVEDVDRFLGAMLEFYGNTSPNVKLTVGGDRGLRAMFDRGMLRQVMVNLYHNSVAALAGEQGTISFTVKREPDRVLIEVADSGPGIPEKIRDSLFDPYVSTKEAGEGMGLGLAISKKIMLDHGGELELLHSDVQGTAFGVFLQTAKEAPHE